MNTLDAQLPRTTTGTINVPQLPTCNNINTFTDTFNSSAFFLPTGTDAMHEDSDLVSKLVPALHLCDQQLAYYTNQKYYRAGLTNDEALEQNRNHLICFPPLSPLTH
jgi:hypothetical protein